MRKILTLITILIMVFSLVACGGKTDPAPSGGTSDPGTSQQEQPSNTPDNSEDKTPSSEQPSSEEREDFDLLALEEVGLTEQAIAPDGEAGAKPVCKADNYQQVFPLKAGNEEADVTAYAKKLVAATREVSKDGVILLFTNEKTADGKSIYKQATDDEVLNVEALAGYATYRWYYNNGDAWIAVIVMRNDGTHMLLEIAKTNSVTKQIEEAEIQ